MTDLRKSFRGITEVYKERALILLDESADKCYLAFTFLEQGTEREIFPESLLDDWGHEIKTLALYDWVLENGLHFPRAEIFGFEPAPNVDGTVIPALITP